MTDGPSVPDDEDLVRWLLEGDESAFEIYCSRHAAAMLARIQRELPATLQPKVGASDILQESLMVAIKRLAEFEDRGEGSFGRWLAQIIDLKVREQVRRYIGTRKRQANREVPFEKAPDADADPLDRTPSPSAVAMAVVLEAQARAVLEALPDDYRQVLRLLQEEGLTMEEAAARMGRSREATKKLYGRALARYAHQLERLQRGSS